MLVFLDRDSLTNDEIWSGGGTICISVTPLQILGGRVPPWFTPMATGQLMEMNARGNGIATNIALKYQWTWKLDSNKLVYNSNSANIMIQDMNKVPHCVVVGYTNRPSRHQRRYMKRLTICSTVHTYLWLNEEFYEYIVLLIQLWLWLESVLLAWLSACWSSAVESYAFTSRFSGLFKNIYV